MPHFVLLLLLFLWSCSDDQPEVAPVFLDQVASAPLLACTEQDGLQMPGSAIELSRSGDTAVVALFADGRTVLLLNDSLRVLQQVELAREGPYAIDDPASVLADGDSLLIADAEGQQLAVFEWSGVRRRAIDLDFAPIQVVRAGDHVALAAAVMGRYPGTPLFTLRAGTIVRENLQVVEFPDLITKALANRVRLLPVRDGLIVLYEFFTPRALHVSDKGHRSLPVPLARGLKSAMGYIPPLPLDEEALKPALLVASDAMVADSNEVLLLVRTGRSTRGVYEKAIMRTDHSLNFIAAYRLAEHPWLMTYLPGTRTAVLVDKEDRWFRCPLP